MSKPIAVYGGSFNPPTNAHVQTVEALVKNGFQVIVIPCGMRPDKVTTQHVDTVHRAFMIDLAFGQMENVTVDLSDLEREQFTATIDLDAALKAKYPDAEIFHAGGTDLFVGGGEGVSQIQTSWKEGLKVWKTLKFIVIERPGYKSGMEDLPPNCRYHNPDISIAVSSTEVREAIAANRPIDDLIPPRVRNYINRYALYRGVMLLHPSRAPGLGTRLFIVADEHNANAMKLAEQFRHLEVAEHPNTILVIGGDGTMIRAVREHWRERAKFFGINAGTIGYLLNNPDLVSDPSVFNEEMLVHHLPMLYVEVEDEDGKVQEILAVNDAWIERAAGATAKLRVHVNGKRAFKLFMADGLIVATSTGCTAYSANAGGPELPIGTPSLVLTGIVPARWLNWSPAVVPLDTVVEMHGIDTEWRPLRACTDDQSFERAVRLLVRQSHIASFQLAFLPGEDLRSKRLKQQFPEMSL